MYLSPLLELLCKCAIIEISRYQVSTSSPPFTPYFDHLRRSVCEGSLRGSIVVAASVLHC